MLSIYHSSLTAIVTVITSALLLTHAVAQVRVFEEAPTIEQLRAIMIPESRPTQGRGIVIKQPDRVQSPVDSQAAAVETPSNNDNYEPGAVAFKVNFGLNSVKVPDA